jgi:hypothetical protein
MAVAHRVALVDLSDGAVLTVDTPTGAALPGYDEPWLHHGELARRTGDPLALPAAPATRLDDGTNFHVFVVRSSERPPGTWRPFRSLDNGTGARIEAALLAWDSGLQADGLAAWYHRGWYDAAVVWIDRALAEAGRSRVSLPVLERAWSLSAVLRASTDDGREVWFKATCEGFHEEPVLTAAVAAVLPEHTPDVIAVDAGRAWMLMEPLPSTDIDDDEVRRRASEIGAMWADAQLTSLAHLPALTAAGLPYRGVEETLTGFERAVHAVDDDPDLAATARSLVGWCGEVARELWSSGLPDTLNHGDLHLGNIAWSPDRLVIYDWTDACRTHPYLDAQHLAASIVATVGAEAAGEFWSAYQARWRGAFPDSDLTRVRELAVVVNDVFQVVTYDQIARAQPQVSRWELGGQVGRLLRRLEELRRA